MLKQKNMRKIKICSSDEQLTEQCYKQQMGPRIIGKYLTRRTKYCIINDNKYSTDKKYI